MQIYDECREKTYKRSKFIDFVLRFSFYWVIFYYRKLLMDKLQLKEQVQLKKQ